LSDDDLQWQTWIRRLADGDEAVVGQFWAEYGGRLQGLAAQHLTGRLYRREAPEDVVQSVCRTFFRRAKGGQFDLADSESLWRLLCAITLTKVREKARYHGREKRRFGREQEAGPGAGRSGDPCQWLAGREPTPDEAAEFNDELSQLLSGLDGEEQQLVELKLQQCNNSEIAQRLGCSERTVRRILQRVRSRLRRILDGQ